MQSKDATTGYKLFRRTSDGLRSLFIDRTRPLHEGIWLKAKPVSKKGYAYRPGWHVLAEPKAPHLSRKNRVMRRVEMRGITGVFRRPDSQGGVWYTAEEIKILKERHGHKETCTRSVGPNR